MGAFTDMLLPDKGSGVDSEKVEHDDEGDPIPGTSRHREFYPEGVADILRVSALILLCFFILYLLFFLMRYSLLIILLYAFLV